MRALYFAQNTELFTVAEPSLSQTTERHKVALELRPLGHHKALAAALAQDGPFDGVILEIQRGWIGRDRLLLARRLLSRGIRVWAHWPAEQAIEVLNRERLASYFRLWAYIVSRRGWQRGAASMARSKGSARRLVSNMRKFAGVVRRRGFRDATALTAQYLAHSSGPIPVVSDSAVAASSARLTRLDALIADAVPVPFPPGLLQDAARGAMPGVGVYIRTDYWAPIEAGGSYGHTCYVAKELAAAMDHFVCFFANRYRLLDDYGVQQIVLDPPSATSSETDLLQATDHYFKLLRPAFEVMKPAFIYERLCLGNYVGALLSRKYRIPYIVEYNGSEISMRKSFEGGGFAFESEFIRIEDFAFKQATMISVVSKEVKAALIARGVPAEKVLVNPNGADPGAYRPPAPEERSQLRAELGFTDRDRVVGFTGTFGGWHGVDVLAAALPGICMRDLQARFLLIGDGVHKRLVDEAVERHQLHNRVRLLGRVPQAEGARLLGAADIYVSPHSSHMVDSRFFGSPTKIFEYMAMGRGIVASDLEQIGEVLSPALTPAELIDPQLIVTNERAVLCEPGDVQAFEDAVVGLLSRRAVADALGHNARRAIEEHYSWARHVGHLWAFLSGAHAEVEDLRRKPREAPVAAMAEQLTSAVTSTSGLRTPVIDTGDAYKDEVQRQWDNDPCGSQYVKEATPHTKEWFLEAEAYRYGEYGPWMPEVMEFAKHAGEQVLEIGGGMGTDLAQFAKHGAHVTDIDLSLGHLELARENFKHRRLEGRFIHHDAETLPFPDDSFDVVYSNGVIHHTPNTQQVVGEIHRVLKPGGKAIIMVYAENSLHYWRNLVGMLGLDERQLQDYSIGEIMSRSVERSDNANARPLVKVYTKKRLRALFSAFQDIEVLQRQMVPAEKPHLLRNVSLETLEKLMGWNLIIKAKKPAPR